MSIDLAISTTGRFLASLMPWIPVDHIVRGQVNNVPAPLPPSIVITEVLMPQFTTTRTSINSAGDHISYLMPKRLDLQIDCYGNRAGEMANIAATMLRSLAATEFFPDGIEPLYCSDAFQSPLITGEKQYENRFTLTFSVQYNEAVTLPTETFNTVGETSVAPADITIPVEQTT